MTRNAGGRLSSLQIAVIAAVNAVEHYQDDWLP